MKVSKDVLLLFLGVFCEVSMAGKSTKVFFFELEIESSVEDKVKDFLSKLSDINVAGATVSDVTQTTNCILGDEGKTCSCTSGNEWSSDMCENYQCCKNEMCTLSDTAVAVCLPDKRVSISGSTTMENYGYGQLYKWDNTKTENHDNIKENITTELIISFSELQWFDSLIITNFRRGSLIVEYTVLVLRPVKVSDLKKVTSETNLNATQLVTKGLVTIRVPGKQPIDIGSNAAVNCTTQEDLGSVMWFLTDMQNKSSVITNGVEAFLDNNSLTDIVHLWHISGSWKGLFTCEYTSGSIKHTASDALDVALLPEISAISTPQFPDCRDKTKRRLVEIECVISKNSENYSVFWNSSQLSDLMIKSTEVQGNFIYYKAEATVDCASGSEVVTATCTFTNNRAQLNKNRSETVEIPIITSSNFCPQDGEWPMTKSEYTAVVKCSSFAVGRNTRKCSKNTWQNTISYCVNQDLNSIKNDVEEVNKGLGLIRTNAKDFFSRFKTTTTSDSINSFSNINTSVNILEVMNNVSINQSYEWNNTIMPDFVSVASNILNNTQSWKNPENDETTLSIKYLQTIEKMIKNSNLSTDHERENVQLQVCASNSGSCSSFSSTVSTIDPVTVVGFKNLAALFPTLKNQSVLSETIILSVTSTNSSSHTSTVEMMFDYGSNRVPHHRMFCVYWREDLSEWSDENCEWGGAKNPKSCRCKHNSAFTIMMAKNSETLPYMEELTYVGLGISIVSLVLCILIELMVWDTVVTSNIARFRHIALINICVCLLLAHCAFLGSAKPEKTAQNWCLILTVVKHFCFLSVFFWMLCKSLLLLHQLIYVFDPLRTSVYLGVSITLGYACPILCVAVTFVHFNNGEVDQYYSRATCWLVHKSTLSGSIYSFIIPVGVIVVINMFALVVVITKIVSTKSESRAPNEKDVARSIIKSIVFLTPVLGTSWVIGFFVFTLDLTAEPYAQIVNYAFTLLNSLQGLLILLTNYLGEKKVRNVLFKHFRAKPSGHSKSETSTKATSVVKK